MAKHYYEGRARGTNLWIPPAAMGKKQLRREAEFLPQRYNTEECNIMPKAEMITVTKERKLKSGMTELYTVKFRSGKKCGLPAVVTERNPKTGQTIRRCAEHLNSD